MKTNYIKNSIWLMAILVTTIAAKGQVKASQKTAGEGNYSTSDMTSNEHGKQVERIRTDWDNKTYRMELVNDKMTELYVDGEKVPAAEWGKYDEAIKAIRAQLKENRAQALRNQEQARLNEIQAKKNQEQAVHNQERAGLNQQQAQLNEIQEKKNEEQVVRNQEQAVRNLVQEKMNQEQASRNEEQARLNEIQAKKNQEQAEENERAMKLLIRDLIGDKIIPDENSLRDLKMDSDEMKVNGVKQPDAVFKKYKEKYARFFNGDFSYRN